jgi:ATP-dependent Clp protease protease subunit
MKFILTLIASLLLIGATVKADDKPPVVLLTKRNTLVMRNVFEDSSVASLQYKAIQLSQNLSATENIYLFLRTPGGSISAGNSLISTLQGLPQKVNTITDFAASMGYVTVQSLGDRYVLPGGILMSHRAAGGAQGQIPGELNTRVKFFTDMLNRQEAKIAKRVGMNHSEYSKLIHDEYWVEGAQAVKEKMADRVINARCDKELSTGKEKETIYTFFGPVEVVYSACPLVSAPLEINFSQLTLSDYRDDDRKKLVEIRKVILTMVYSSQEFYYDYITTNKYKQYFQ